MGYDRGILATTEQFDAYKPADAPNQAIAKYETDVAAAGVLGTITRTRRAPTPASPPSCASAVTCRRARPRSPTRSSSSSPRRRPPSPPDGTVA